MYCQFSDVVVNRIPCSATEAVPLPLVFEICPKICGLLRLDPVAFGYSVFRIRFLPPTCRLSTFSLAEFAVPSAFQAFAPAVTAVLGEGAL